MNRGSSKSCKYDTVTSESKKFTCSGFTWGYYPPSGVTAIMALLTCYATGSFSVLKSSHGVHSWGTHNITLTARGTPPLKHITTYLEVGRLIHSVNIPRSLTSCPEYNR